MCLLHLTAYNSLLPFEYGSHFIQNRGDCILYWSPVMISFCSLCLAPCDLWALKAHTKTKGTSQQMRYRFFVNVQSITCIWSSFMDHVIICIFEEKRYWPAVTVTFSRIKEWDDQFQVSCLIMIDIAFCWQGDKWEVIIVMSSSLWTQQENNYTI